VLPSLTKVLELQLALKSTFTADRKRQTSNRIKQVSQVYTSSISSSQQLGE
jgi:hypothetical protein